MGFSNEWEEVYVNQQQLSIWPWTDLVSYIMRYVKPELKGLKNKKILELGFGAGANIPFYKAVEADFYGIDGSQSITETITKKYPKYAQNIKCGDFTKEIPFKQKFDIITDRASLTHNDTVSIKNTISLIKEHLRPGGYFLGIDWFSTEHSESKKQGKLIDNNTKVFSEGYFCGVGQVHFSDQQHIRELFKDFKIIKIEHKVCTDYTSKQELSNRDPEIETLAVWNFLAKLEE